MTQPQSPHAAIRAIALILIVALASGSMGCAKASTTGVRRAHTARLPAPTGIVVYDFEPTGKSVGLGTGRESGEEDGGMSSEELANRREVGRVLADVLAKELDDRGILSSRKTGTVETTDGVMAVGGQLITVDEGSRAKRIFIGFGSGRSQLTSVATLYGTTPMGQTELWEYQNIAASGAKPGILTTLPIGMAIQGLTLGLLLVNGGLTTMGELSSVSTANAKRMADELADSIEKTLLRVTRR